MIYLVLILTLQGQVVKSVRVPNLEVCIEMTTQVNAEADIKAACFVKVKGDAS